MPNKTRFIPFILLGLWAAATLVGCAGATAPATAQAPAGGASEPEGTQPASSAVSVFSAAQTEEGQPMPDILLYQGHASLRITTAEGKVIYIDPYAGEGYDKPADLILVTHQHPDHNQLQLVETQNPGCQIITQAEALAGGKHNTIDTGFATVTATLAQNQNHNPEECVGYVLTLPSGKKLYFSGDTSKTDQMAALAGENIDYAFFCCDGRFNMDVAEASESASLVNAKHSLPYHMQAGELFSEQKAEAFTGPGKLVLRPGEEIEL